MGKVRVLAERLHTWNEILIFLDNIRIEYAKYVNNWEEEISYIIDEDIYKVTIRVKI